MHGYDKKLIDSEQNKEKSPKSGLLKNALDSKPSTDPISNPSHVPLSKKLEELRRSFQEELDRDLDKDKSAQSETPKADISEAVSQLEQRFAEMKSSFLREMKEAGSGAASNDRIHKIEKRLDILMRMFEAELQEKYEPEVTVEDFQRLEKRINILKKMFDTQISKKSGSAAAEQEISELEKKFDQLQKTFQSGAMEISLESLATDIVKLDNAIGLIQERFLKDLNSRLNEKASLSDLQQLDQQIREVRNIISSQANRGVDTREIKAITHDVERFQRDVSDEVTRLEKNLNDLRKLFQSEFNNNTDARLLARDLSSLKSQVELLNRAMGSGSGADVSALQRHMRDMDQRLDLFKREIREQLNAGKGSDVTESSLRKFEKRFEDFQREIEKHLEDSSNPAFVSGQVKKLEEELEDLRTIVHGEFAKFQGGVSAKYSAPSLTNFKAFEEQLSEFKKIVIEELNKKADSETLRAAVHSIEQEFKEIREKIQIALEHSADSKRVAQDIETLAVRIEEIKHHDIESLSADFRPFAEGLDSLREDIAVQKQRIESENIRIDQLEAAQAETAKLTGSLLHFQKQYEAFKEEIHTELKDKGIDDRGFLSVVNDVSESLEQVTERIGRLDSGYARVDGLESKLVVLENNLRQFQSETATKTAEPEEINVLRGQLETLRDEIQAIASEAEAGKVLTLDVRGLEDEVNQLKEGYQKVERIEEDARTISEDIEKIERDILGLKSFDANVLFDQTRALQNHLDALEQDFKIEFDKLTESRLLFKELPRIEESLNDLRQRTQSELNQKVAYDEFKDNIESLENRLERVLSDLNDRAGSDYLSKDEGYEKFVAIDREVKQLRDLFEAEYTKINEAHEASADIQDFQLKLLQLSEKVAKLDPEKHLERVSGEISDLKKSLEKESTSRKKSFKDLAASLKPRPMAFYIGVGVLALLIAGAGLGVGVQWMRAKMVPSWEKEMAHMQNMSSMKLDRYLTSDQMQQLIDQTARSRTQEQIDGTFKRSIEVFVDVITGKVNTLVAEMESKSNLAMQRLDEITNFSSTTAAAINGDRQAFDQLAKIGEDASHPFHNAAIQAIENVFVTISALNAHAGAGDLEREKATYKRMSHFEKAFETTPEAYRPDMLLDLWASEKIAQEQKIDFLMNIVANDNSLLMVARATELVDQVAGLYMPFTQYHSYIHWWNQKKFDDSAYAL